jgi:hypothetical protein
VHYNIKGASVDTILIRNIFTCIIIQNRHSKTKLFCNSINIDACSLIITDDPLLYISYHANVVYKTKQHLNLLILVVQTNVIINMYKTHLNYSLDLSKEETV